MVHQIPTNNDVDSAADLFKNNKEEHSPKEKRGSFQNWKMMTAASLGEDRM